MKSKWTPKQINFVLKQFQKGFSRTEITRQYNNKFDDNRSQDSIKHCIEVYGSDIEKNIEKVLVLDIETRSLEVKTFGLFDQNIGLNQIVSDGGILSWSAKWLGSKEVFYKDVKGDRTKEKELLLPLWKLMDEATIVLGQNSNSFDIKTLNAKFLELGLGAPSEYKKIDTLRLSKKHFKFVSHKLEYMSKKFCKIKKLAHSKFPGFTLWDECEKGNKEAWKEMSLYNKNDVLATEELFLSLAEFDKTKTTTDAIKCYNHNKNKK